MKKVEFLIFQNKKKRKTPKKNNKNKFNCQKKMNIQRIIKKEWKKR